MVEVQILNKKEGKCLVFSEHNICLSHLCLSHPSLGVSLCIMNLQNKNFIKEFVQEKNASRVKDTKNAYHD